MTDETKERIRQLAVEIEETPRYPHRSHLIYVERGNYKVPISICHGRESGFYGSARIGNKSHSAWAKTPADAVAKIVLQLGWTISRLEHERGQVPSVTVTA